MPRISNIVVLNGDQGDEVFFSVWMPLADAQALLSRVQAGADPTAADAKPVLRAMLNAARAVGLEATP